MTRPSLLCLAALGLALPGVGWATEDALYDAPIPEDAAFVRWLAPSADPQAFGARFSATLTAQPTYVPVSAADLPGATPGAFYSVHGADLIAEPARDDPAKVHLILLNTSSTPARLVVAQTGQEVIAATPAKNAAARAVNPVAVSLAVQVADTALATFDVTLRRGQNLTFVVTPTGAHLIENGFATTARPL